MKPPPPWRRRLFLAATVVAIVLLSAHPELRLFVPLMDAFGFDLFAWLVGAQAWECARPILLWTRDTLGMPIARQGYAFAIFMFGYLGPVVHATLVARYGRGRAMQPA